MMKKITLTLTAVALGIGLNAQISVFPNTTDFESQALCGTSCTGTCNLTGTWRNADQWAFPQAGTDWLAEDGATPSTSTGPDVDHTTGTAAGKYVYVETSGCTNTTAHLVSDICDFSAVSSPRMSFWWHMYGATMGTMHVDVDTTGLGNWVLDVVPSWTANVNTWQFSDISVSMLGGRPSTRIRIRMQTGSSFTSDAALDDITIYQPLPENAELTSVLVGGGCGNSTCTPVEIQIANVGSDTIMAGTQMPVSFEVNSVVVTDTLTVPANILPGDTISYTFVNGCVDLSGPGYVTVDAWLDWSADLSQVNDSGSTLTIGIPLINTFPYYEDFEAGQNGWLINNGAAGTWAFGTPAKTTINGAASGVNAFVTGGLGVGTYMNNDNSYVEGPCFDFTNVCDPVISMSVWWNAEFSWDGMNIITSIDGGQTWQLQGAMGDVVNWYNDNTIVGAPGGYQEGWSGRVSTSNGSGGWVNVRHRLTGVAGQSDVKIRIAFGTDGSVTDDGVAFDNVLVTDGVYLGSDQMVCSPATVTLNANFGTPVASAYAWSTGATTPSISVTTTGWYWVDVTGATCTNRDSVYVVVGTAATDVALGADSTVCTNNYTLDAGYWPGSTYTWDDNSTAQTRTITAAGTYYVSVVTPCGTMMDSITITMDPASVNLGADFTNCGPATLDAGSGFTAYAWSSGGTSQMETISASGTYDVMVTNASGCSAMDTIVLTINALPAVSVAGPPAGACSGDTTFLLASGADEFQWINGPATDLFSVAATADSTFMVIGTDTLTGCADTAAYLLIVNQPTAMTQTVTLCYGDSIAVGSSTYTTSGIYVDVLTNAAGCDSTITTNLTVDTLIWTSQSFTICPGDSVVVGTNTYTASGVYSDTLAAWNGCDSVVTTNLNVNPVNTFSQSLTICAGQSAMVGTSVYSASGTYVDTLTSSVGCDSVVTTTLIVDTVDVSVSVGGFGEILNANNTSAVSYQWIDCTTMQPIAGATSASYTATANGNYAVIIQDVNCADTSACVPVTNVGIAETTNDYLFNVFPNPTFGDVTITSTKPTQVVIFNALGEVVMAQQVQNTITLDLSMLEGGVYFIRTNEGKVVRLVKE